METTAPPTTGGTRTPDADTPIIATPDVARPAARPAERAGGIVTATRTPGAAPRPPAAKPDAATTTPTEPILPPLGMPMPDGPPLGPPSSARTPGLEDPATLSAALPSLGLPTTGTRPAAPPAGAPVIVPPPNVDGVIEGESTPGRVVPPVSGSTLKRRRLAALLVFVLLAILVLLVGQFLNRGDSSRVMRVTPAGSVLPPAARPEGGIGAPTAARTTPAPTRKETPAPGRNTAPGDTANTAPAKPADAAGAFTFVAGYGPVLGTAGTLRRFKVSVERNLDQGNGGDFADEIDRILGDPRSWIAGRQYRLQRVPQQAASEFTVYLASAETSEKMCDAGGLRTNGFTSCRLPGQVIINRDRWEDAVPDYDAPLEVYRAYAINHEVGHQLGHGHEACPGEGRAAPVMQQQTYGLKGCVANAWPYLDGKRYFGPPVD